MVKYEVVHNLSDLEEAPIADSRDLQQSTSSSSTTAAEHVYDIELNTNKTNPQQYTKYDQQQFNNSDGVFNNIPAKPDVYKDEPLPPAYDLPETEQVPPYFEATVSPAVLYGTDGDILIEGMEVGNTFSFIINVIMSMSFDFIGYMLTTMMALTHSARCGSKLGLGITLFRYGIFISTEEYSEEVNEYRYYDPDSDESGDNVTAQNATLSYILMILGFIVILQSSLEYYRISRLRAVILSTENSVV